MNYNRMTTSKIVYIHPFSIANINSEINRPTNNKTPGTLAN